MEHVSAFMDHHSVLAAWLIAALGFSAYFFPSMKADEHRHRYANAIFILNLMLGWTVLGWIGALIWAYAVPPAPAQESTPSRIPMFANLVVSLVAIGCGVTIYALVVDSQPWDAWKIAGVTAAGFLEIMIILRLLENWGSAERDRSTVLVERHFSESPDSPVSERAHWRFPRWRARVRRWGRADIVRSRSYDELVAARQDVSIAEFRQGLLFLFAAWTFAGALVLFLVAWH